MTGEGLDVLMGGEPVPVEYLPYLSLELLNENELRVTDTYERTTDEGVTMLVRSFETTDFLDESVTELDQQGSVTSTEESSTGSSPLLGKSVRFSSEEGIWSARMEDTEDRPKASLDTLYWNLEFRSWAFPEEAGARSWSLPGAAFAQLAEPGGDLSLEWTGNAEARESLASIYGGNLKFRRKSPEGSKLIEVDISGDVHWTIRSLTELTDIPITDGAAVASSEQELELEGELIWDAEAGHLVSLTLNASMEGLVRLKRDPGLPGPTFESRTPIQGSLEWSVEFEPAGE